MAADFLIIGAQKAGTTWLYQNLRDHPQLYFPPEKELHYFDLPPIMPFRYLAHLPVSSVRHWCKDRMLRDQKKVDDGIIEQVWFDFYYKKTRTHQWYHKAFEHRQLHQLAGEATPRYAIMGTLRIRRIKRMLPNLKLIYLLRDPLERVWSDIAMYHRPNFGSSDQINISSTQLCNALTHPQRLAASRYYQNLQRWLKVFDQERIFVGYREEISESPQALLEKICRFLGVGIHPPSQHLLKKAINSYAQHYQEMPVWCESLLAEHLYTDCQALHDHWPSEYSQAWLIRMEAASQHHRA